MAYATLDDVKAMFRDYADNADAAVNDADLTLYLDNTTAIINAKIGTLYAMPITNGDNPESFKILKQLQMFKVACIVDDILNNYSEADKKPDWCKKAHKLLEALVPSIDLKTCKQCPPTMKLPDADYLGVPIQRNRIRISSTTGQTFRKGEDNW